LRRFERIISLVAVIGVLLHAGLLVRHNGIMLDAAFDRLALSFAGGVICHGDGSGMQPAPGTPSHSGEMANCQVCVGAMAGAAILPPLAVLPGSGLALPVHAAEADQHIGQHPGDVRPPSRAPPAIV
jgi:hypothetical protein